MERDIFFLKRKFSESIHVLKENELQPVRMTKPRPWSKVYKYQTYWMGLIHTFVQQCQWWPRNRHSTWAYPPSQQTYLYLISHSLWWPLPFGMSLYGTFYLPPQQHPHNPVNQQVNCGHYPPFGMSLSRRLCPPPLSAALLLSRGDLSHGWDDMVQSV